MKNIALPISFFLITLFGFIQTASAQSEGYDTRARKTTSNTPSRRQSYMACFLIEGGLNFNTGKLAKHAPTAWSINFSRYNRAKQLSLGYSLGYTNNRIKSERVYTEYVEPISSWDDPMESYSELKKFNMFEIGYGGEYRFGKDPYFPYVGLSIFMQFHNIEYSEVVRNNNQYIEDSGARVGFNIYGGAQFEISDNTRLNGRLGYSFANNRELGLIHSIYLRFGVEFSKHKSFER